VRREPRFAGAGRSRDAEKGAHPGAAFLDFVRQQVAGPGVHAHPASLIIGSTHAWCIAHTNT
jgi:hypothetical protein